MGYKFSRCADESCFCESGPIPDYTCATSPGNISKSITSTVAACAFYDYNAAYQIDWPTHTADMEITLSGGDPIFAPILGTYTLSLQSVNSLGCYRDITFVLDPAITPPGEYPTYTCTSPNIDFCTDFYDDYPIWSLNMTAYKYANADVTQFEINGRWCNSGSQWEVYLPYYFNDGPTTVCYDYDDGIDCNEDNVTQAVIHCCIASPTYEAPVLTITPRSGTKTADQRLGTTSQTQLAIDLTRAIYGGESPASSRFKLKVLANSVVVGSTDLTGTWTYNGSYYDHPAVNVTLTGTLTGTKQVALYYDTVSLGSLGMPCLGSSIPAGDLSSGTILNLKPPSFKFTAGASSYGSTIGDLANEMFLTRSITSCTPHVIVRDSGDSEVEDCGSAGMTSTDYSGFIIGKSSSDIVRAASTVSSGDSSRLEFDDGSTVYQLSSALTGPANSLDCYDWYPSGFIQARAS